MLNVGIIDSGLCNIDSIRRTVTLQGANATATRDPDKLASHDKLILPGVGAFGAAMEKLNLWGLSDALRERAAAGTPVLGICLGMQLLATDSKEGGMFSGLDLVPGSVVALRPVDSNERIPHMGWNVVNHVHPDPLFEGIEEGKDFYFVHSFHMRCARYEDVLARTPFCGGFVSAVRRDSVWGVQFHPEKSIPEGHKLLANFLAAA